LFGGVAMALAAWICFHLGARLATAVCVFLIIIVLLSLMDSLISSLVFSVIAVGLLDYFFTSPILSFAVDTPQDIVTLTTYFITAFAITGLVRRKRDAAETLRDQAQLLELTHDTVMVRDDNDMIRYWNQGAARLYGWLRHEAIGQSSPELLRTVFPIPLEEIKAILQRDGYWEGEFQRTRKDGTTVIVASRWSTQSDGSGRRIGTLETTNDITERRRAEEALRRSQAAYLAEAQKISLTGSFGWNPSTDAVFWSEQSFSIFECEPGTQPSIDLMLRRVHSDDVSAVRRAFECGARENSDFNLEFRLQARDDAIKHVRLVARATTNGNGGGQRQFVGAVTDITAARKSEEQLHQARAELAYAARIMSLGALSASIAHEVNQPLAAIVVNGEACLRWLARGGDITGEVSAAVRSMIGDGKRASEIVHRIRALSRRANVEKAELSLNGVIEEVVPLVQREVAVHRASLELALASDVPAVLGDRVQLQQVIVNLVLNAVQAMAAAAEHPRIVTVTSSRDRADGVVVAVRDLGIGIKPDDGERIFDAFFTTKADGMGMGLSICRSIIEAHGGQIWATGNSPEPGATFRFNLPAAEAGDAHA
jgi:PAS domain S-box-containing protein